MSGNSNIDGRWWTSQAKTKTRFYRGVGSPVTVNPWLIRNEAVAAPNDEMAWSWVDVPAMARVPETKTIGILRGHELGDVLVALAAARYIRRAMPHLENVILFAQDRFHPVLTCQTEVVIQGSKNIMRAEGELIVDFTGYFELDHKQENAKLPRIERVLRTFGFEPPYGG